jgi:hypothetical protein
MGKKYICNNCGKKCDVITNIDYSGRTSGRTWTYLTNSASSIRVFSECCHADFSIKLSLEDDKIEKMDKFIKSFRQSIEGNKIGIKEIKVIKTNKFIRIN